MGKIRAADAYSVPVTVSGVLRHRWPMILALIAGVIAISGRDEALARALLAESGSTAAGAAAFVENSSTRLLILVYLVLFVLAWAYRSFARLRAATLEFFVAWGVLEVVVRLLKTTIGRPRPGHPSGIGEGYEALSPLVDLKSFPSGHAAVATLGALVFASQIRRTPLIVLAFTFAAFVAWGRVAYGAHYPVDVFVGAAVAWLVGSLTIRLGLMNRFRIDQIVLGTIGRATLLASAFVVLTWLLGERVRIEVLRGWDGLEVASTRPLGDLLFEPLSGTAAHLSRLPGLKGLAIQGGVMMAAFFLFLAWRWKRRALVPLAVLAAWIGVVGLLAISGRPLERGLEVNEGTAIRFDPQIHLGDPHDGRMDEAEGRRRLRRLGYDAYVPTWHGRWGRAKTTSDEGAALDLWGMEWSPGDPASTTPHLLLYARGKEAPELPETADVRALVSEARRLGILVFLSHGWRGEGPFLDDPRSLFAAGIDGAEIRGRESAWSSEARRRRSELERLATLDGRRVLAGSDFHGQRAGAYAWTLVRGSGAGEDLSDLLWEGLRGERGVGIAVLDVPPPPAILEGWGNGLWAGWSYFGGLAGRERLVWLGWIFAVGALATIARRRSESRS